MAHAVALVRDLMFGSRLQGSLGSGPVTVELAGDARTVRERLGAGAGAGQRPDVLVVDLTDPDLDGPGLVAALRAEGALAGVRTVGFYAHVDVDTRRRALRAGFDVVVPRSRIAREAAAVIAAAATG
jgi:CheY-like chemotaxis protein